MAIHELFIGAGTTDSDTLAISSVPFNTIYHDQRFQYIILESDLNSAGITAGMTLDGIYLLSGSVAGTKDINNFTVRIKHTANDFVTIIGGTIIDYSGFTTVLSGYSLSPQPANNWSTKIPFDTTFIYNGGNIAIDITRDNYDWDVGGSNILMTVPSPSSGYRSVGGAMDASTVYPHDDIPVSDTFKSEVLATKLSTVDGGGGDPPPEEEPPTSGQTITGNLAPDTLLESTGFESGGLTSVQDSPSSPDANWMTTIATGNSVARFGFPTPTQPSNLDTGVSQRFSALIRPRYGTVTDSTVQLQLYKNGTLVSSDTSKTISSTTGQIVTYDWTAQADDDGSGVELRVVITGVSSGKSKGTLEIGAVEWSYTAIDTTPTQSNTAPSTPTNITPTNGSTTDSLAVSATITDAESQAKLVVEYDTVSDFSSSTVVESGLVDSGTVASVTLTGVNDGETVYLRLKASDGTLESSVVETSFVYDIPNEPPPTGDSVAKTLRPLSIIAMRDMNPSDPAIAVTYIQDDPSSPDANGLAPIPNSEIDQPYVDIAFDSPNGTLTGQQSIIVNITDANYVGHLITVYENGIQIAQMPEPFYGTKADSTLTWDASLLTDKTGAGVTVRIGVYVWTGLVADSINAVSWNANVIEDAPVVGEPTIPTDLFPFPASAWKRAEVKATIASLDNTPVKLVVEHGTSPTLSTFTTTTSASVASGTSVTLPLGTYVENDEIYWRAYTTNDTVSSDKTAIYNYTYLPNGSFSPDGTAFMQQANDAIHERMIDVSSYQGVIDWVAIKNSGVNYAYLRTWGADRSGNGDTNFVTFVNDAKSAGVLTGGYFYCMPSVPLDLSQARQEADRFIAKLQEGYGTGEYGDLIPMLDLEDNTGTQWTTVGQEITKLTVQDMLLWANEFRNYFEQQTGRTLGLYTTDYFVRDLRNNFNHDDTTGLPVAGTQGNILKDMPLWISGFASYPRYKGRVMPSCGGWIKWQALQYGDTNLTPQSWTLSGIEKPPTDLNAIEPVEWIMPPKAVNGLSATDNGTDLTLTWDITTEEDVNKWDIYINGNLYTSSDTDGQKVVAGLAYDTPYTIEVRPVDDYGDDPITTPTTINYTLQSQYPKVTIISVSKLKISDEPEFDRAEIVFAFDKDINRFTVNVDGVDYNTGFVAHSGGGKNVSEVSVMTVLELSTETVQTISIIVAGVEIIAEVDYTELSLGQNRVNIYGRSVNGLWTPYNQS